MNPQVPIIHMMQCLWRGQSPARICMNVALKEYTIRGKTVDVGGGRAPDYFNFLRRVDYVEVVALDGSISGIDFERDRLPYTDGSVDTVVLCNVLEHIYRHAFLLSEVNRVLKPGGELIGFVPFWIGYHPDPCDFFRYTQEALKHIFADAGFTDVQVSPVGGGPFLANFNTIALSMPRLFRPFAYVWYVTWDSLFVRLRPQSVTQHPLGFTFVARVPHNHSSKD